jgi:hypothetical protein
MRKSVLCALLLAATAFGQYKLESAGAAPAELAPAIREALQKDGAEILAPDGSVFCEVWFRTAAPKGPASSESGVTLKTVPHGALLGALRFPNDGQDRRGFAIKAGVYTLRYSLYPPDGNHQGVATQRDFLLMVPAADDKDVNATPSYDEVVAMSSKSTGTPHPGVLGLWKDESGHEPGLAEEGEEWVLYTKIGDIPVGIILVGLFTG